MSTHVKYHKLNLTQSVKSNNPYCVNNIPAALMCVFHFTAVNL